GPPARADVVAGDFARLDLLGVGQADDGHRLEMGLERAVAELTMVVCAPAEDLAGTAEGAAEVVARGHLHDIRRQIELLEARPGPTGHRGRDRERQPGKSRKNRADARPRRLSDFHRPRFSGSGRGRQVIPATPAELPRPAGPPTAPDPPRG